MLVAIGQIGQTSGEITRHRLLSVVGGQLLAVNIVNLDTVNRM